MVRLRAAAIADVLGALSLVAWIGGHEALGAFAARIAFQELPRPLAAQMMTRVFHEFGVVVIFPAIAALLVAALLGVWARPARLASQLRLGLELGLCALGVFELGYVHPAIEGLYAAGRTLEPAFAAMHRLSERCGHAELLLALAILVARRWPETKTA